MTGWRDLGNLWTTFKELDIRPLRDEADRSLLLAFVGRAGCGKSALISALGHGGRAHEQVSGQAVEADLGAASRAEAADLIVLVLDATREDFKPEAKLFAEWRGAARNVLVFYNKMDLLRDANAISVSRAAWGDGRLAFGSAHDPDSLAMDEASARGGLLPGLAPRTSRNDASFVPRVMEALSERHLALARHYPLFRLAVTRELIGDTSLANATYALGTGLAEVIPALDVPFNVADIVILTKNQALLVYKLGLALGLSPRWQDHLAQLGGVVGAGFLWRQIARQLVGLIPVWGLVPKVAVAYAGTYAVGEAIVYWYQTGHKLSGRGMREIYADALARGKQVAQELLTRAPRPAFPRVSVPALARPRKQNRCPNCDKNNPRGARFCAYCATAL